MRATTHTASETAAGSGRAAGGAGRVGRSPRVRKLSRRSVHVAHGCGARSTASAEAVVVVRRAAEDGARRHVRRADRGRIWVISRRRSGSCSSSITVGEPWPTGPRQKRHINDRDPRTRFEGGFGRRSTAVGARGSWSILPDLIDFAAKHIHEAIGIQSSGPSDHVWRPPGANVALGARARTRSVAATRRPWGRRCEDMGSELIMSMGEGRGALISAGPDVVSCGVGVARR